MLENSPRNIFILLLLCIFSTNTLFAEGTQSISNISSSVLYSGQWKKSTISSELIHCITQDDASELGIELEKVAIFSNRSTELSKWNTDKIRFDLFEIPTWLTQTKNGENILYYYHPGTDSIAFNKQLNSYSYQINKYTSKASIFVTQQNNPKRIAEKENEPFESNNNTNLIDAVRLIKPFEKNLLQSGREFVSSSYAYNSKFSQELTIPNRDKNSPVVVQYQILGKASSSASYTLALNDQTIRNGNFSAITSSYGNYADEKSGSESATISGSDNITVTVSTNGVSSGRAWINKIILHAKSKAYFEATPLLVQNSELNTNENFEIHNTNSGLTVWNLDNSLTPTQISNHSNGSKTTLPHTSYDQKYLLFDASLVKEETYEWKAIDQTNILNSADCEYLIVTHPIFLDQANKLAALYKDEMSTKVVTTEQIYQVMSTSVPDVSAIRNYIRHTYYNSTSLNFVLLLGSGTYDNRSEVNSYNPNYIPSYQSANYLSQTSSFVSDDFFALLTDGEGEYFGTEDVAVGRIPAINEEQATVAIDKIVAYKSGKDTEDWLNTLCFVADDEDGNIHMENTEELAENIREDFPEMTIDKIYFDAYEKQYSPTESYPKVNSEILKSINNGMFLFNYTGHSNEEGLAHEKVFNNDDIESLTNDNKLPIFVTASCDFSRWDYKTLESAGEKLLFHKQGGAIALLSSSRLVYSSGNFLINKYFLEHLFDRDANGKTLRLGEVFLKAKNFTGGGINSRKFGLFGDPALQLRHNTNTIQATKLDNNSLSENPTISVLEEHVMEGVILNEEGTIDNNYSENLSISIIGGAKYEQTLGNGGETPFKYRTKSDQLFQSTAEVENGEFIFPFILPFDVDYSVPEGMFIFSSYGENKMAMGSLSPFTLADPNQENKDLTGPEITLYLNTPEFSENDVVGNNPILYAKLFDESGINTSEYGIGHDMEIIIDGDTSTPIVVSDGYETDNTNFKHGILKWQLTNLETGYHTIRLRTWDNANNASYETISFKVTNSLQISDLTVFPNPIQEDFQITFNHNKAMEILNVKMTIFDMTGKRIVEQQETVTTIDNTIDPILVSTNWLNLLPGIYILEVITSSTEGEQQKQSTKLLVQ